MDCKSCLAIACELGMLLLKFGDFLYWIFPCFSFHLLLFTFFRDYFGADLINIQVCFPHVWEVLEV